MNMTYTAAKTCNRIMLILADHVGRENALPRAEVERLLKVHWIDTGDRKIREAYSAIPIGSCEKGLYTIGSYDDIMDCERYWRPHMSVELLTERVLRLKIMYPQFVPVSGQEQLPLFGEEART